MRAFVVRCLAGGRVALTALRVPLDARELNATLPKAALAKVLDVVAFTQHYELEFHASQRCP